MSTEPDTRDYWQSHYDSMAKHESLYLFDAESNDYFARLKRSVPLSGNIRVLDFGCGLGFVTRLLAAEAGEVGYWDYSANMLETAAARLDGTTNTTRIELGDGAMPAEKFDLIVVNSVIQYMEQDVLESWLERWRELLNDDGKLLISDIILPTPAFLTEVWDSLRFARAHGFLVKTLKKDFMQYVRYLRARRQCRVMPGRRLLNSWSRMACRRRYCPRI